MLNVTSRFDASRCSSARAGASENMDVHEVGLGRFPRRTVSTAEVLSQTVLVLSSRDQ